MTPIKNLTAVPARFVLAMLLLVFVAVPSRAFAIQEVRSPGGLTAWLVEDHSIPLIAMSFSFQSGSASDPAGKEGVATFLTGMMDEGAADLDSASFQKARDDLGFRMSFNAVLDNFEGTFQTLSSRKDGAFGLLHKAITAPRFDAAPLERMRQSFTLGLGRKNDDPEQAAFVAWMKQALPGDPYATDSDGTVASLAAMTSQDLKDAHHRIFSRTGLKISVVGDMDAASLAKLLDQVFGDLPKGEVQTLPPAKPFAGAGQVKIIARDIPQSIIVFGHEGPMRDDPGFIPAFVMSEILGGGGFGSRMTEEIREKRGLTYGVGASFNPLQRAGLYIGSLSTRNEKAGEALTLVRQVMRDMADKGPTQAELNEAKTYLTGSYALRFTSNSVVASQLLGIQQQGLGINYVETRNSKIDAVTLDQAKAEAKRLLHPDRLFVTIVGKPEGLK